MTETRFEASFGVLGGADGKIVYTYDVYWNLSDTTWASRWDAYLRMPGGRVHWFSIMTSLMVLLIMSSMVAMILMRTVRRDLARYEGLLREPGAGPSPPSSFPPPLHPTGAFRSLCGVGSLLWDSLPPPASLPACLCVWAHG